jgi:hypothetical protein
MDVEKDGLNWLIECQYSELINTSASPAFVSHHRVLSAATQYARLTIESNKKIGKPPHLISFDRNQTEETSNGIQGNARKTSLTGND